MPFLAQVKEPMRAISLRSASHLRDGNRLFLLTSCWRLQLAKQNERWIDKEGVIQNQLRFDGAQMNMLCEEESHKTQ